MSRNPHDAVLDALAAEKRRCVLDKLTDQQSVTVEPEDSEKVVELGHNHLPRLVEEGLITYEREGDTFVIEPGSSWDEYERVVEQVLDALDSPVVSCD